MSDFINKLLSVNPIISAAWQRAEIVNDVLSDNVKSRKALNSKSVLRYLPKGKMESDAEYQQRIDMTPWLPRTAQIINDRQGAIFSNPPAIEGVDKEKYTDFEFAATSNGKSLLSVIANASRLLQTDGWFGILLDRAKLPEDVQARGGEVSIEEARQRKLGQPQFVLYPASQIFDFEKDSFGLSSVKIVSAELRRQDLLSEPTKITTVRIIDRINVATYLITESNGVKTVSAPDIFKHEWVDEQNKPVCPFIISSAFSGDDGIGRPQLTGCAQSDIAATRVLSDICWTLFILGNPILTFKTNRDENELPKWGLGATRFIPLKLGSVERDGEALEFAQLDAKGLELLIAMHQWFCSQCEEQAGSNAAGATTEPVEQSGISRAWQFKTGQERVLFLITRELQACFDTAMNLIAVDMGRDPNNISIKFNENFDTVNPKESVDIATKMLGLVQDSQTATAEIKKRVLIDVYPDLPNLVKAQKELDEIERNSIDGVENEDTFNHAANADAP